MKYHEKRLVVSSRLYQRVMVKSPAGMKPASHSLSVAVSFRCLQSGRPGTQKGCSYPSSSRVTRKGPRPF